MFKPVERDVYVWTVPDSEFGEMMNGHLYIQDDGYALVDPPLMPDLLQSLGVFGKCNGIVLLSGSHKRGAMLASQVLAAPLYIPEFAAQQVQAPNATLYKKGDKVAGDLTALELSTEIGIFGEHKIHEMALVDGKNRLFISDVCHGLPDGKLNFAPEGIFPGYTQEQVKAAVNALARVMPNGVHTAFFGHGADMKNGFAEQVEARKKELNL